MSNRRILTLVLVGLAIGFLPAVVSEAAHAKPHAEPEIACTISMRGNVWIGPNAEFYECICEALTDRHLCDWHEIIGDTAGVAKLKRKIRVKYKTIPRLRLIVVPR